MPKETHQAAYEKAKASALSGQALIKQALAELYRMPVDRLIVRPGLITESQFLEGQYIELTQGSRVVIQPLPSGENPSIPVIMKTEDIAPAMEALEQSLNPDQKTLHGNAEYLSAKELVDRYQADPTQPISELLATLSYKTSKTGYTGHPFSPANALCAQMAWLAVDKNKRNPQSQFWTLLLPQVIGTHQVISDTQWPAYGEALLDQSLVEGKPGELLNYRLIFQAPAGTYSFSEETWKRIRTFHPAHYGYWHEKEQKLGSLSFKNYDEFFSALIDFTYSHSKKITGHQYEMKINPRGDRDFTENYAPALMRFYNWYDNLDLITKRSVDPIFSPVGKTGLIQIIKNLSFKQDTSRCLDRNSHDLITLFDNNQDLHSYLKTVPFELCASNDSLAGADPLNYIEAHSEHLETLDFEGLIHEAKLEKGISVRSLVKRFKELPPRAPKIRSSKAEDLFNFLYYINDIKIETAIVEEILLDLDWIEQSMKTIDAQYFFMIFDRLSMPKKTISYLEKTLQKWEAFPNRNELGVAEKREYLLSLIRSANKGEVAYRLIREIEKALFAFRFFPHLYLNTCSDYAPDVHAILSELHTNETACWEKFSTLTKFLSDLKESKQKTVYQYIKNKKKNILLRIKDLKLFYDLIPSIADEIVDDYKDDIMGMITNEDSLICLIKFLPGEKGLEILSLFVDKYLSRVFFRDLYHFRQFVEAFPDTQHVLPLSLNPLIKIYVKNIEDLLFLTTSFSPDKAKNVSALFEDKLLEWANSGSVSAKTFTRIALIYPPAIFKALIKQMAKNKTLPGFIDSLINGLRVIANLDITAIDSLSPELRTALLKIIDEGSDLNFMLIHALKNPLSSHSAILEILQDKITTLAVSDKKILSITNALPADFMSLLLDKINKKVFEEMSLDSFVSLFTANSAEINQVFIKKLQHYFDAKLDRTLGTPRKTIDVYLCLEKSPNVYNYVLLHDFEKILQLIASPQDFIQFVKKLQTIEGKKKFFHRFRNQLNNIFKTTADYLALASAVAPGDKKAIVDYWNDHTIVLFTATAKEISLMLSWASSYQKEIALTRAALEVNKLIHSAEDIQDILYYATPESRTFLCHKLVEEGIFERFKFDDLIRAVYYFARHEKHLITEQIIPLLFQRITSSKDFDKINLDDSHSFSLVKNDFYQVAQQTLKIYLMLNGPDLRNPITPNMLNSGQAAHQYLQTYFDHIPLLRDSWKLACIRDPEQRTKCTYEAVLQKKGLNEPPKDGSESPRLSSVRKLFNTNA